MMRSVSLGRAMMLFVCAVCLIATVAAEAQRATRNGATGTTSRVPKVTSKPALNDDGGAANGDEGGIAGTGIEALSSVRLASGLAFPTSIAAAPGDMNHMYITQKAGLVRSLNLTSGVLTNILNVPGVVGATSTNDERGLLCITFHPNYPTDPYLYVNYTGQVGAQLTTFVKRFTVTNPATDPIVVDSGSGLTIIQYSQPFSNHNGGWVHFGPNDGYLYVSAGDGGDACDPGMRAQNLQDMHGKLLRLDINGDDFPADATRNYAIPPDNPFVGVVGADDEIWAYGLRNPWRPGFDSMTGDLFIADVGQFVWEEIDFQPASSPGGENYGWDCLEGFACSTTTGCTGTAGCNCATVDAVDPIGAYNHSGSGNVNIIGSGCSITGGVVYRGSAIPTLQGTYFYSDFCGNFIDSFSFDGTTITNLKSRTSELFVSGFSIGSIVSYGEDNDGEVYIVDQGSGGNGEIYKIIPAIGACCFTDGSCADDQREGDCTDAGGAWQGKNTQCATTNCPAPDGACCLDASNCIEVAESTCASFGGIFHGPGSVCTGSTCLPATGACCLEDGSCIDGVPQATCESIANATYNGDGSLCSETDCGPAPTGACCLTDGSCTEDLTQSECETNGGTYQGDFVLCDNVECPLPVGACCMPDGGCTDGTTSTDCEAAGGTYQGDNVGCGKANCPQPTGACCFPDGSCVDGLFAMDCDFQGGVYQGDATLCSNISCPQPCLADIVDTQTLMPPGDGIVNGADLGFLLNDWGANPGSLADIVNTNTLQPPPDGMVNGADLGYMLNAWGPCP